MSAENKGVYFTELKLQNVRCFGDEAVLKLCNDKGEWSKWNVILGDNGTGKTTLLQCLAGMEIKKHETLSINGKDRYSFYGVRLLDNPADISYHRIGVNKDVFYTKVIIVVVNSTLVDGKGNFITVGVHQTNNATKGSTNDRKVDVQGFQNFILGYGANRRISFQILSEKETKPDNSATLFDDDAKLINAEEWLYQIDYAAAYAENNNTDSENYTKNRRDLILKLLVDILPDIDDIKFVPKDDPSNPRPVMRFKTLYGWVGIHELSYGYKTMVAWVVDVAARMFRQYPNEPNPLAMPVVILVDEIDLHLHPKWQRQIFDFLEERLPRAQFIVTAHSPLIVQSAPKDANIIVLKKEKVGDEYVVRIDNDKNYVRNWRVDQILASDLFDEIGVRNKDVEKEMADRRILLKKDHLTSEETERLRILNELSYSLPTANNPLDIEAMDIIREAANFIKKQQSEQ